MQKKTEILFLGSGPYALDRREENDKFKYFSEDYSCIFLTPVNPPTKKLTGLKETKVKKNFTLFPFSFYFKASFRRNILSIYNLIFKALFIYFIKNRKFNVVISRTPLLAGLCALIIAKLTGAKSVVEVNGDFAAAFKYDRSANVEVGFMEKIKDKVSKYLLTFVLRRADGIKLLYSKQLNSLFSKAEILKLPIVSFPDFVPIKYFLTQEKKDDKYILLIGFPWYLKGVDILIKAFNSISDDFPDYRLKIIGWCPEGRGYFENLAKGNNLIHFCDPLAYKNIIPFFLNCSLYVLASRTEAMGRVLLEAMASRKPIIASRVGGVPAVIIDGYNGLLFESENTDELAEKIRLLLTEKEYSEQLARNGYKFVKEKFSENAYIDNYRHLIDNLNNTM